MQETFPSDSVELERLSAKLEIVLNVKSEADEALQEFKDDNAELVSDYNAAVSAEEKAKDAYHSALDSNTGKEVLDLFAQLHEMGNTIVMITHDLSVASHAKRMVRIVDDMLFEEDRFSDVPFGNESRSLSGRPDSIIEPGSTSGGNGVFTKEGFCPA